jgi:hypothetical protein
LTSSFRAARCQTHLASRIEQAPDIPAPVFSSETAAAVIELTAQLQSASFKSARAWRFFAAKAEIYGDFWRNLIQNRGLLCQAPENPIVSLVVESNDG